MNEAFLQQKWLQNNEGKLCYFSNQRQFKNRPTVIFLHGLSSNHTTWNVAAHALEKFKLNFLLPDLRGHGYSDKTKKRDLYKLPVFTEDLNKIIEKENLSRPIIIGYSFGGFIALDYIIKHPTAVSALILISANHTSPLKYKKIDFLTQPCYGVLNLLAWLLLWQKRKTYYYFNQETAAGYWNSTFKGFSTMPISINLWMLSEALDINFSNSIEKINCPTLIIKSKSDPFLSLSEAEDMRRKIKLAKIIVLEESSHFLASRYQQNLLEIIINFLKTEKIIYENSDF